jgi:hypothetical protein
MTGVDGQTDTKTCIYGVKEFVLTPRELGCSSTNKKLMIFHRRSEVISAASWYQSWYCNLAHIMAHDQW